MRQGYLDGGIVPQYAAEQVIASKNNWWSQLGAFVVSFY